MSWKCAEGAGRRRGWSIAGRLSALYGLSTFAVLLVSVTALHWALVRRLEAEDVEVLREEIQEVREILGEGAARPGSEILREASVKGLGRYLIRVDGGASGWRIETADMGALVPGTAFPDTRGDQPVWRRWASADGRSYLLMTAQVPVLGESRLVQIALDRSREEALASDYRRILLIVLLAGVLASTAAGVFITRRGLAPLTAITRTAARVTPEQLGERIGAARWPTELRELADVFDGMLARLEDAFLRLSHFSADLAHELRTPVSNLMGGVEVALGQPRSPKVYRSVLESALEECGRLAQLIDSLLFLARAESGRAALSLARRDLGAEAAEVCDFYSAAAEEKGVELTCSGGAVAEVDPLLVRRAIDNLLANALSHTPAGGRIEVCVEEAREGAMVAVSDTGCGIAPEHLSRVFDRFYRADAARPGDSGGAGLGLSLVKSIAELHRGSATMKSEVGCGTTVCLTFPPGISPPGAFPIRPKGG